MEVTVLKKSEAMTLQYMSKTKFSLDCIGLWPNKSFGDKSLRSKAARGINLFLFVATNTALYGEVMYIKNRDLNFMDLGHSFITTLMTLVFIQRLALPYQKAYCEVTKEFVLNFHIIHHKHVTPYAGEMNDRVNRICTVLTHVCHCQIYVGLCLFNVVPLYKNFNAGLFSANKPENSTYEQAIYYDLPIDQYTDFKYYTATALYNWSASYFVIVGFCCFDLLISIFVIHIWGHLSILKDMCESFPRPKDLMTRNYNGKQYTAPWYSKEENDEMCRRLRDIIKYHEIIKKFMMETSAAYGTTLCVYYAFHQFTGCVFLLECSTLVTKAYSAAVVVRTANYSDFIPVYSPRCKLNYLLGIFLSTDMEALGKFGILTIVMFQQLIQLSVIFELIGTKGDALIEAVYGLPWESMDSRNRGMVLLFLQNVQIHLALKAGDMVPVGVMTMLAIIKTSISYFMMLKTLGND